MELSRDEVSKIVEEVVKRYAQKSAVAQVATTRGVYEDMDECIDKAYAAQ